jgi:hypothetical protein
MTDEALGPVGEMAATGADADAPLARRVARGEDPRVAPDGQPRGAPGEDRLPPVTEMGMASLALIVAGGIYLSAHLPHHVARAPAVALLAASALLLAGNLAALSRVRGFAWRRFWQIARWAQLAYAVAAGMIEYAFLQNHMSGGTLVVLTLSLVVFAVHVPTLIAFTVARYHVPGDGR